MRIRSDAEPAPPLPNLYEGLHLARPQTPGSQGEERPPLELEDNGAPIGTQMGRAASYNDFESFQASVWENKIEYPDGQLTCVSEAKDKCEHRAKGEMLSEINGTMVHLNPAKTYASLFLSMERGRCGAVIPYQGREDRVPDFKPESKADEK